MWVSVRPPSLIFAVTALVFSTETDRGKNDNRSGRSVSSSLRNFEKSARVWTFVKVSFSPLFGAGDTIEERLENFADASRYSAKVISRSARIFCQVGICIVWLAGLYRGKNVRIINLRWNADTRDIVQHAQISSISFSLAFFFLYT